MHQLQIRHIVLMFWGNVCGFYFITNFGRFVRTCGTTLMILMFIGVALFFYALIGLVRYISKDLETGYEIARNAFQSRWAGMSVPILYSMWNIIAISIYMDTGISFFQKLGFSVSGAYLIYAITLFITILQPIFLAEIDSFLTTTKLAFLVSFVLIGIYFIDTYGAMPPPKTTWTLKNALSALTFVITSFCGLEEIVNSKVNTNQKVFNRSVQITPFFVFLIYLTVIIMASFLVMPNGSTDNMILFYLEWTKIPYFNIIIPTIFILFTLGSTLSCMYIVVAQISGMHHMHATMRVLKCRFFTGLMTSICILLFSITCRVYHISITGLLLDVFAGLVPCIYPACRIGIYVHNPSTGIPIFAISSIAFFVTLTVVQFLM